MQAYCQAYFPPKNRVYNINRILDVNTYEDKWKSKTGIKLTQDDFVKLSSSSILELQIDPQIIPSVRKYGIVLEYNHFYLDATTSQMFKDPGNYSIEYNKDTNSATFTINKRDGMYNILPVNFKSGQGGRPRRRSTFRQRKLKRTAAKSRRATRTRRV